MIAALCFMKEWFVLVPVGLALWELVQMLRSGAASVETRRGARPVDHAVRPSELYVLLRFDEWPASPTRDFLQLPADPGQSDSLHGARMGMGPVRPARHRPCAVPLLATLAIAFLIGIVRGFRSAHRSTPST